MKDVLSILLVLVTSSVITGCANCTADSNVYEIELWAADLDTGKSRPVFTDWQERGGSPRPSIVGVSPDESALYYVDDLINTEIKKIDLNSSTEEPLGVQVYDERVALSPDGRKIIYQRNEQEAEIWTVSTGRLQNNSLAFNETFSDAWNPVWLQDSNTIMFSGYGQDMTGLYLFHIQDSSLQKLTSIPQRSRGADITADGRLLTYRIEVDEQPVLYTKDMATGDSTRIGPAARPVRISPTGSHLVFQHGGALRVLDLDNDERQKLESGWYDGQSVVFAPDGEYLAFENESGLALVNMSTSNKQILAYANMFKQEPGRWDAIYIDLMTPTFTQHGSKIYFFVSRHNYSDGCP